MTQSWFVFAAVVSIVLFSGMVLAVALMRAAWAQRESEALTASDLRAVEESALLLIDQLRSEADRSISDLDARLRELHELIAEADARLAALREAVPTPEAPAQPVHAELPTPTASLDTQNVLRLASRGLNCVEIARATGLDCADVKVALKLGALAAER